MKLLDIILGRGFSIGKTVAFKVPQRTRGGGRGGRMPGRVSPPCQMSAAEPKDAR